MKESLQDLSVNSLVSIFNSVTVDRLIGSEMNIKHALLKYNSDYEHQFHIFTNGALKMINHSHYYAYV